MAARQKTSLFRNLVLVFTHYRSSSCFLHFPRMQSWKGQGPKTSFLPEEEEIPEPFEEPHEGRDRRTELGLDHRAELRPLEARLIVMMQPVT